MLLEDVKKHVKVASILFLTYFLEHSSSTYFLKLFPLINSFFIETDFFKAPP